MWYTVLARVWELPKYAAWWKVLKTSRSSSITASSWQSYSLRSSKSCVRVWYPHWKRCSVAQLLIASSAHMLTLRGCTTVVRWQYARCIILYKMPGEVSIYPLPPQNSAQPGLTRSLLYGGSKFRGHQKSKGNSYDVEVELQVGLTCSVSLVTWWLDVQIYVRTVR